MAIADYLTEQRIIFLKGKTKRAIFEELVGRLAPDLPPGVDRFTVLEELWKRESLLSTRVSSIIAMPHAIVRNMKNTLLAIGISRKGVAYEDTKEELPIQLVAMLVGGGTEHLQALSEVSSKLNNDNLCRDLLLSRSPAEVHALLASPYVGRVGAPASVASQASILTVNHAIELAREAGASRIILHADAVADDAYLERLVSKQGVVLVTTDRSRFPSARFPEGSVVSIPFRGINRANQVEVSLLFLLSQGLINKGERIVSVYGVPQSGLFDSVFFTDVDREFKLYFAFDSEERPDDLDQQVLTRILQIANDLAVEGREGKSVGTLFVVGDYQNVKRYCQQLIVNPFQGYHEEARNILDPSLEDTIKEYSRIDGAFIIRGDGVIMSAGTYLKADSSSGHFHSGLGARHAAAATITAMTKSIAVAISESTQKISLFRSGERFLQF